MYLLVNKYHPRHDPRHDNEDKGINRDRDLHPRHDPRHDNKDDGYLINESVYARHDAIHEVEDNAGNGAKDARPLLEGDDTDGQSIKRTIIYLIIYLRGMMKGILMKKWEIIYLKKFNQVQITRDVHVSSTNCRRYHDHGQYHGHCVHDIPSK